MDTQGNPVDPKKKKMLTTLIKAYEPEAELSDEDASSILEKYKGNEKEMLRVLIGAYEPETELSDEDADAILDKYGFSVALPQTEQQGLQVAQPQDQQPLQSPQSVVDPETGQLTIEEQIAQADLQSENMPGNYPENSVGPHEEQDNPIPVADEVQHKAPATLWEMANNAIERGLNQGELADLLHVGQDGGELDVKQIAYNQAQGKRFHASEAYQKFNNAGSVKEALSHFASDPLAVITELTLESGSALLKHGWKRAAVGMAGGAALGSIVPGVGTVAGATTGFTAGVGMAGLNLEYSGKIIESLNELGIDTSNPEDLKKAFSDEALYDKLRTTGLKKGIPIALLDMMSLKLAGRILGKAPRGLKGKALASITEFAEQTGMDAAGEMSGQMLADGKINPVEVLAEVLGGSGQQVAEIGGGALIEAKKKGQKFFKEDVIKAAASQSREQIQDDVDYAVAVGDISPADAQQINDELAKAEAVLAKVPADFPTAQKVEAATIIEKRQRVDDAIAVLEKEKETIDPAFHESRNSRIAELKAEQEQHNSRLKSLAQEVEVYNTEADGYFESNQPHVTNPISTIPDEVDAVFNKIEEDIFLTEEEMLQADKWANDAKRDVLKNGSLSKQEKRATLDILNGMLADVDTANTKYQQAIKDIDEAQAARPDRTKDQVQAEIDALQNDQIWKNHGEATYANPKQKKERKKAEKRLLALQNELKSIEDAESSQASSSIQPSPDAPQGAQVDESVQVPEPPAQDQSPGELQPDAPAADVAGIEEAAAVQDNNAANIPVAEEAPVAADELDAALEAEKEIVPVPSEKELILSKREWQSEPLPADDTEASERISYVFRNRDNEENRAVVRKVGIVSSEAAKVYRDATGLDIEGAVRTIDNSAIKHVLNRHGEGSTIDQGQGQVPVTEADLKLIPLITSNPDKIEFVPKGANSKSDVIRYTKRVNGHIIYLEEVRSTKAGQQKVALNSMWKKKKSGGPDTSETMLPNDPPSPNAPTRSGLQTGSPDSSPPLSSTQSTEKSSAPIGNTSATANDKVGMNLPSGAEPVSSTQSTEKSSQNASPAPVQGGVQADFPVADLNLDPDRFQYKVEGKTDRGDTGSLAGVKAFNKNLAGVVSVWRDPADGKTYVVNGHNRVGLANDTNTAAMDVRFIAAATANEARAIGALQNIAEGKGTSIDAAKFLRDTGMSRSDLEKEGVRLNDKTAREGMAMANLSDGLFRLVINGKLSVDRATAIGMRIKSHDVQEQFLKLVQSKERGPIKMSHSQFNELADLAESAPKQTSVTQDLFGSNEQEQAQILEKAEVLGKIRDQLNQDKNVFGNVARNADMLQGAGNQIDQEGSRSISEQAKINLSVFDKLKSTPEINRIINAAVADLNGTKPKSKARADIHARTYRAVTEAISGIVAGSKDLSTPGVQEDSGRGESRGNEGIAPAAPTVEDQLKQIHDDLDVPPSDLFTATSGLDPVIAGRVAAQAAIKLMIKSIQLGRTLTRAISDGIQFLRSRLPAGIRLNFPAFKNLFTGVGTAPSSAGASTSHAPAAPSAPPAGIPGGIVMDTFTWSSQLRAAIQDRMLRLKQLQKSAAKAGINISDHINAYLKYELVKGKAKYQIDTMWNQIVQSKRGEGPSLFERIRTAGITIEEFGNYLYAKHAPERNAELYRRQSKAMEAEVAPLEAELNDQLAALALAQRGITTMALGSGIAAKNAQAEIDKLKARITELRSGLDPKFPLNPDGLSGMTDQQAADILQGFDSRSLTSDLENFSSEFRDKVIVGRKDLLVGGGLMTEEDFEKMDARYEHYVPLQIFTDTGGKRTSGGKDVSVRGKDVRRAKGSLEYDYTQRHNPAVAAITNFQSTALRSEKNLADQAMLELAKLVGKDEFTIHRPKYVPQFDAEGEVQFLLEHFPDNIRDKSIMLKVEGKPIAIEVHDEALLKALAGVDVQRGWRFLQNINSYLRGVNTVWNPEFLFTNFVRDLQTAMGNVGVSDLKGMKRELAKNIVPAMKGIFQYKTGHGSSQWSDTMRDMVEHGGEISWLSLGDTDVVAEDVGKAIVLYEGKGGIKKLRRLAYSFGEYYGAISSTIEMASRLAAYKAAVDKGMSKEQAASLAKNLTVNFEKKGNLGMVIDSAYLFANAGIQGSTMMLRALAKSNSARAVAASYVAAGFLSAMFNDGQDDEEDDYLKIHEGIRNRNLVIMKSDGSYYKMPLAYGFNIFKALGEHLYMVTYDKEEAWSATKALLLTAHEAFNPIHSGSFFQAISPTALDMVAQIYENKNWFGAPIKPEQKPYQPEAKKSSLYFQSVRSNSKAVTDWLNEISGGGEVEAGSLDMSPEVLDHILDSLAGGLGKMVFNTMDLFSGNEEEQTEWNKKPIIRNFRGSPSDKKDLGLVFDINKRSATEVIPEREAKAYELSLTRAAREGYFDQEDVKKYRERFEENQLVLTLSETRPDIEPAILRKIAHKMVRDPELYFDDAYDKVADEIEREERKAEMKQDVEVY